MTTLYPLVVCLFVWHCAGVNTGITLDFVASAPGSYDPKYGGGAYNTRRINTDVVESLTGGQYACGDHVTFLTQISLASKTPANLFNVKICYKYTADTTGQSGVAFTQVVDTVINYDRVSNGAKNPVGV